MFTCTKCGVEKDTADFYTDKRNTVKGVTSSCKECMKHAQRERNKTRVYTEKDFERSRRWDVLNRDKNRERSAKRRKLHPEKVQASHAKWAEEHPERKVRYRHGKRIATPKHAKPELMKVLMKKARQLGLTVDHIVPIVHPLVCGLHCWDNLQLLDATLNYSKGNRYWPDMPDALSSSELSAVTK